MKIIISLMVFVGLLFSSIDINMAGVKKLTTLKGIGKAKAEEIVKYRKMNCFKSVNDLTKVKGIGKKTVEKNRADLTVSKCK